MQRKLIVGDNLMDGCVVLAVMGTDEVGARVTEVMGVHEGKEEGCDRRLGEWVCVCLCWRRAMR